MSQVVVFPDVEAALVTYLGPLLSVPVVTRIPQSRPSSFVHLSRVGGTRRDVATDAPMILAQCWASTEPEAGNLAQLARAHMHALSGTSDAGLWIGRVVEVGGPQVYPDPMSQSPRVQFTSMMHTRGAVLV